MEGDVVPLDIFHPLAELGDELARPAFRLLRRQTPRFAGEDGVQRAGRPAGQSATVDPGSGVGPGAFGVDHNGVELRLEIGEVERPLDLVVLVRPVAIEILAQLPESPHDGGVAAAARYAGGDGEKEGTGCYWLSHE